MVELPQRDPQLPPPEVVDWLLAQRWEIPTRVVLQPGQAVNEIYDMHGAQASIARDETLDLLLSRTGLMTLKADQLRRYNAAQSQGA